MNIVNKTIGIVVCVIGLAIWGIDYLIFTAIGALTAWIAAAVGITGLAVLGIQIIGWIFTLGIMIIIFLLGVYLIFSGLIMILE